MAPALVQSLKAVSVNTGASLTASTWSVGNLTIGNRVLLYTTYDGAGADVTVAGGSLTWTKLIGNNADGSNGPKLDLWTAVVTANAGLSITVSWTSGTSSAGFTAEEWSGVDGSAGSGCLDVSATGSTNVSNTTNCSSGTTVATHAAGQLAIVAVSDWGISATWTLSTANGFTKNSAASLDANANAGNAVANKISASGALEGAAVWTNGNVADQDTGWVVVLKAAAGAASGIPDVTMAQIG